MPAYFHDTPIDVPDGSWVRFDSDSSGTPAAVFSRSGQPIVNSVVFSQTGSVPRVTSDAATLYVRLALQTGVARSGVVAQTSGVAFTSFDSDSDITGRGGASPGAGTTDQTARDSVSTLAASLPGTYAPKPTPTATKTAAYTAAAGELAVMNVAAGATVLTLPAAPADKTQVAYRAIGATAAAPMTIARGGTDTIGTSGATTASIPLDGESGVLQYDAANTRWLGISNVKPQAALDLTYAPKQAAAARRVPFAVGFYGTFAAAQQTTAGTSRVPFYATNPATLPSFSYANFTTPSASGDTDPAAAITISASVEVGGTIYRLTFGGQSSVTIAPGGVVTSDPLGVTLPAGIYYVRTYTSSTAWYANHRFSYAGSGGFTATTDLTAAGSAAIGNTSNSSYGLAPVSATAVTAARSAAVVIIGDSIGHGLGDAGGTAQWAGYNDTTAALGRGGFIARALTPAGIGHTNLALPSETLQTFVSVAGHMRRGALITAGSTAIVQYGRNDLTAGRTLAAIQADMITAWLFLSSLGMRVMQTTITPASTSTDNFATTANQTPASSSVETVRVNLNTWLRAGAPVSAGVAVAVGTGGALVAGNSGHPLTTVIEVADLAEPSRNAGVWRANVASRTVADAAMTSGGFTVTSTTAAFTTADLGRTVLIQGAGASGANLFTTITAVSGNAASTAASAGTTVSGASATIFDAYTQDGIHPQNYATALLAAAVPTALIV